VEKKYIYSKAANGMTVRIPAEKYPAWKKAQDEIRAGRIPDSVRKMEEQLASALKSK
jgi:hypothetical protein